MRPFPDARTFLLAASSLSWKVNKTPFRRKGRIHHKSLHRAGVTLRPAVLFSPTHGDDSDRTGFSRPSPARSQAVRLPTGESLSRNRDDWHKGVAAEKAFASDAWAKHPCAQHRSNKLRYLNILRRSDSRSLIMESMTRLHATVFCRIIHTSPSVRLRKPALHLAAGRVNLDNI